MYCRNDLENAYEKIPSICIVDDEYDTLNAVRIILEENCFRVEAFTDPILALDEYGVRPYDLLILDIRMPKMNGFELYKNMKKIDPKVKVCFLTAVSDLENYASYKKDVSPKFGERHFILKPIENIELLCIIRTIIST
jgi:DNA-binding response OmpR family regulator